MRKCTIKRMYELLCKLGSKTRYYIWLIESYPFDKQQ